MPSVDSIIDGLSWHSCCEILTEYDAPPSNHNTVEQLQTEVRHRWESGEIPAWAIRQHADDDRDARLQACHRVIRDNTHDAAAIIAELKAENAELRAENAELRRKFNWLNQDAA